MNEGELKSKIAKDFNKLIADLAAAETLADNSNPFSRVSFNADFLNAELSSPIMKDDELKNLLNDVDKAIERNDTLKNVVALVGKGLKLAAKYAI